MVSDRPIWLSALLALSGCQVVSGLDEIEIVASQGGAGGVGGAGGAGVVPCENGLLDRNRDPADGCEMVAPVPTAGLVLWLSPDFGITVKGGGISEWLDQSSRRSDFIQEHEVESRPTLLQNELNGLAVALFDGDKLLSKNHLTADFSQGITFAIIVRRDATGYEDTIFDMVVAGGPSDSKNIYLSQKGDENDLWFGSTVIQPNVTISSAQLYTPNTPHLLTIRSAPGSLLFQFDGEDALPQPDVPPTMPVTEALSVVLGANIAPGAGTRYHHGVIAEVVLYERALDDGELAGVEQYLTTKWGCCN
jgi:hypothetical protein